MSSFVDLRNRVVNAKNVFHEKLKTLPQNNFSTDDVLRDLDSKFNILENLPTPVKPNSNIIDLDSMLEYMNKVSKIFNVENYLFFDFSGFT
jgi:glycerol-3-phosphate O-acyltransferase